MDGVVRAFDAWMNGGGALLVAAAALVFGLGSPVFILVHELGHALVGLARTEGLVQVRVGREPGRWRFRVGRLVFVLNPIIAPSSTPAGLATTYARMERRSRIAYAVAGPFVSGALSLVLALGGLWSRHEFVVVLGALGVAESALCLVPRRRNGLRSDGAYLLDALRGSSPEPDQADASRARWFVLFTDARNAIRTTARARLLLGAQESLGFPPDDRSAVAVAVWKLAFAAWCWRAVEPGDCRDAALDAVMAATRTGANEPELTIVATRMLAQDEEDGDLVHMPTDLRPSIIAAEEQRFAFRYGLALCDIERARGLFG